MTKKKQITRNLKAAPCREMLRALADYLDGELPLAACRELKKHLRQCRTCDCVLKTLKKTISMYRKMPEAALPRKTHQHLMRALKHGARQKTKTRRV